MNKHQEDKKLVGADAKAADLSHLPKDQVTSDKPDDMPVGVSSALPTPVKEESSGQVDESKKVDHQPNSDG